MIHTPELARTCGDGQTDAHRGAVVRVEFVPRHIGIGHLIDIVDVTGLKEQLETVAEFRPQMQTARIALTTRAERLRLVFLHPAILETAHEVGAELIAPTEVLTETEGVEDRLQPDAAIDVMHVLDIATILNKAVIHHKHIALAPRHLAHGTREAQTNHRREPATHTEGDVRTDGLTIAQLSIKQEVHTVRELEEPRLLPTQQQRVGGEQIPDGTVPDILQALPG